MTEITTRRMQVTSPAPRDVWRELLERDPDALPTQSPEWADFVCETRGLVDASRLYVTADGQRAVLPLLRRQLLRSPLVMLESMPAGWGYGGILSDNGISPDLVGSVVDDLAGQPAVRVHVRPNPLHGAAWAAGVGPGVTALPTSAHVLDLRGGFETVWNERFNSKTRNHIRKGERTGVVIECDTSGRLVPVFHELLVRSFDRWADQQHEPRWLARIRGRRRDPLWKWQATADRLGPGLQVWVAWYKGKPAASILVLRGTRNAHHTRGAMDKELAGQCQAPSLLQKAAIEDACRAGCLSYHMGETGSLRGVAQYKGRLGAVTHDFAEYRLERLPLTTADHAMRGAVKRVLGYRDE